MPAKKRKAPFAAQHELSAKRTSASHSIASTTISLEDQTTSSPAKIPRRSSFKSSKCSKPSLVRKEITIVDADKLVTKLSGLKSGSIIGETTSLVVPELGFTKEHTSSKTLSKRPSRASSKGKSPVSTGLEHGEIPDACVAFRRDFSSTKEANMGIRIAVIAHGDYWDARKDFVRWIDFGATLPEICKFMSEVQGTFGRARPECYGLVLKRARETLTWTPGSQRVLVMLVDDEPHPVGYSFGVITCFIDLHEECELLRNMGVKVYSVQAGSDDNSVRFFKGMAALTGGPYMLLASFTSVFDSLMMICYQAGNPEMMSIYEHGVRNRQSSGGMTTDLEDLVKFAGASGDTDGSKVKKKTAVNAVKKAKPTKELKPSKATKTSKAVKEKRPKKVKVTQAILSRKYTKGTKMEKVDKSRKPKKAATETVAKTKKTKKDVSKEKVSDAGPARTSSSRTKQTIVPRPAKKENVTKAVKSPKAKKAPTSTKASTANKTSKRTKTTKTKQAAGAKRNTCTSKAVPKKVTLKKLKAHGKRTPKRK